MKLKTLIENSNIPASLIRAVVRQVGGWESFKETALDVCNHGGAGVVVSGFIYYRDTCPFYWRNRKAIIAMAKEQASDFGVGVFPMLQGFRCMSDCNLEEIGQVLWGKRDNDETIISNCLAWYALEEVAKEYQRLLED